MIYNKIKFRNLKITDSKLILTWRRKKRISKNQYTNISNSLVSQKKWLINSFNNKNFYHWLILFKNKPIGYICIKDLDLKKKETDWGYYIGSDEHLFLGAFIPPYFYNWVFKELKINIINSYVFLDNKKVIKLHHYHKYLIEKKFNVIKNNKEIKCIKMTLKKKNWEFKKYLNFIAKFPLNKNKNFKINFRKKT